MWMSWSDITEIFLFRCICRGKKTLYHQPGRNCPENEWNIGKEELINPSCVVCVELCAF